MYCNVDGLVEIRVGMSRYAPLRITIPLMRIATASGVCFMILVTQKGIKNLPQNNLRQGRRKNYFLVGR